MVFTFPESIVDWKNNSPHTVNQAIIIFLLRLCNTLMLFSAQMHILSNLSMILDRRLMYWIWRTINNNYFFWVGSNWNIEHKRHLEIKTCLFTNTVKRRRWLFIFEQLGLNKCTQSQHRWRTTGLAAEQGSRGQAGFRKGKPKKVLNQGCSFSIY